MLYVGAREALYALDTANISAIRNNSSVSSFIIHSHLFLQLVYCSLLLGYGLLRLIVLAL